MESERLGLMKNVIYLNLMMVSISRWLNTNVINRKPEKQREATACMNGHNK